MRKLDDTLREFDSDASFMCKKTSRMEGHLFLNGCRAGIIIPYSQQFLAYITP